MCLHLEGISFIYLMSVIQMDSQFLVKLLFTLEFLNVIFNKNYVDLFN